MKILEARKRLKERLTVYYEKENLIMKWVGLLAESNIDIKKYIVPIEINTTMTNIAGANVPVFKDIKFIDIDYNFYDTPFWLDRGIEELREWMKSMEEAVIVKRQIKILEQELRVTSQRVNLFEKIKIPECKGNIRKIGIYLGDQQANAVGVSKVAKKKVELKNAELAGV